MPVENTDKRADDADDLLPRKLQALHARHLVPETPYEHRQRVKESGDPNLPPARRPMRAKEVAAALHQRNVSMSHTYWRNLLEGSQINPGRLILQGLADLFGVTVAYLVADCPVMEDAAMAQLTVSERINLLFEVSQPGPEPITDTRVAAAIGASVEEIRQLRDGTGDPTLSLLSRTANFFGVPLSFLTDAEGIADDARQRLIEVAGLDPALVALMRRTSDLEETGRVAVAASIAGMVQAMEKLEERDPAPPHGRPLHSV